MTTEGPRYSYAGDAFYERYMQRLVDGQERRSINLPPNHFFYKGAQNQKPLNGEEDDNKNLLLLLLEDV